jgi:hypothetical protein
LVRLWFPCFSALFSFTALALRIRIRCTIQRTIPAILTAFPAIDALASTLRTAFPRRLAWGMNVDVCFKEADTALRPMAVAIGDFLQLGD